MSRLLARLRHDLDLVPSAMRERPGLLVRDPFRYSDAVVLIPPLLVRCLVCFDGAHSDLDLRSLLTQLTGLADTDTIADGLTRGLSEAGFLDDPISEAQRAQTWSAFNRASVRPAAFAGGGYPDERGTLVRTLRGWLGEDPVSMIPTAAEPRVVAIAAPHVSPAGGISAYRAAYRALPRQLDVADCTFVILGTSHYGQPDRFGLTRKPFQTPLGLASTDTTLVDELARAAPDAVDIEDYCHAIEHSIEFQLLFLQGLFGSALKILPILCGPFQHAADVRKRPEDDPGVARVLDALARIHATRGERIVWVLGVDMAHIGRRYGDSFDARAHGDNMSEVTVRDHARLDRIAASDAGGFWDLVHEHGPDDMKWCGSAPLYSFLRIAPLARGQLLHYDQWNIDEASVVSFAALSFTQPNVRR